MAVQFTLTNSEYLELDTADIGALPFTLAVWVRPDSGSINAIALSLADKDGANVFYGIGFNTSDQAVNIRNAGGSISTTVTVNTMSVGAWGHVCGVFTSATDTATILNGDLDNKGTNVDSRGIGAFDRTSIGRLGDSTPGFYTDGAIAEAAIWNVALSDAEVAALANGFSPRLIRPGNLVSYRPLYNLSYGGLDTVGNVNLLPVNTPTDIGSHPPMIYPALVPVSVAAAAAAASSRLMLMGVGD